LEGSAGALQSRLDIVRAAINEITLAHNTLDGFKSLQEGEDTLIPIGAGSYVRMKIADSKKLVMGIGAGAAIEKDVDSSVEELKGRLQELDKARNSIQQQLEQTLARYQQDRDALEELLGQRGAAAQPAR
jgi:prefoldin alpha subunit